MQAIDIKNIAVVGAGLMGHGIAQEFALGGYKVHLHDLYEDKLQEAKKRIHANLQMLAGIGMVTQEQLAAALDKVQLDTELEDAAGEADLVIESVSENLEIKQGVFQDLDRLCPSHTILASNSSTLIPSKYGCFTKRPDKVIGAHYFNPPYLLPLVEIIRSEETSDETLKTIYDLMVSIGKKPAIVRKEAPGFIGNRLQAALLREACSIVEQGIADPEDVDIVVKNGFGRRLSAAGVFEIFDLAGLDVFFAVAQYLLPYIESSTETPAILREKVEKNELGVKTGKGFYEWTPESAEGMKQQVANALINIAQWSKMR